MDPELFAEALGSFAFGFVFVKAAANALRTLR
jgi:hypothetical protein